MAVTALRRGILSCGTHVSGVLNVVMSSSAARPKPLISAALEFDVGGVIVEFSKFSRFCDSRLHGPVVVRGLGPGALCVPQAGDQNEPEKKQTIGKPSSRPSAVYGLEE